LSDPMRELRPPAKTNPKSERFLNRPARNL
jgi:hypothetical protein